MEREPTGQIPLDQSEEFGLIERVLRACIHRGGNLNCTQHEHRRQEARPDPAGQSMLDRLADRHRGREQQGEQSRIGLVPPTKLPTGESDGDQRRSQCHRERRPRGDSRAATKDQPSHRQNQQQRQQRGPDLRREELIDQPGPKVGLAPISRQPGQPERGQIHLQAAEAVGQPHRNRQPGQSHDREREEDDSPDTPLEPPSFDPDRNPLQHDASAEPRQSVERVIDPQLPGSQVGREVLDQVGGQASGRPSQRPGRPRQGFPRHRRIRLRVAAANPRRDQTAHGDSEENEHLAAYADPQPEATDEAGEEEPAPCPISRLRRPRIRRADPGQQREDTPERQNPHQPLIARHSRHEPGGKWKESRQSDREQRGRENAELPRHECRGSCQEQQMQQRVGVQRRLFHGGSGWAAGHQVVEPGNRSQPPPIRRRGRHVPAKRGILVIDMADAPFPADKHLPGLVEPLVTVAVVIRHNQPGLPAGATGWRGGGSCRFRRGPFGVLRHILDMPHPQGIGPDEEPDGTEREGHPGAQRKSEGIAQWVTAFAAGCRSRQAHKEGTGKQSPGSSGHISELPDVRGGMGILPMFSGISKP